MPECKVILVGCKHRTAQLENNLLVGMKPCACYMLSGRGYLQVGSLVSLLGGAGGKGGGEKGAPGRAGEEEGCMLLRAGGGCGMLGGQLRRGQGVPVALVAFGRPGLLPADDVSL